MPAWLRGPWAAAGMAESMRSRASTVLSGGSAKVRAAEASCTPRLMTGPKIASRWTWMLNARACGRYR
jgi:hypothetical protein